MRARASLVLRSLASMNMREKRLPKPTLSEHPPQSKEPRLSCPLPRLPGSHAQCCSCPLLQARVMACTTPAAEMAYTNAASRLPKTRGDNKCLDVSFTLMSWSHSHLNLRPLTYLPFPPTHPKKRNQNQKTKTTTHTLIGDFNFRTGFCDLSIIVQ